MTMHRHALTPIALITIFVASLLLVTTTQADAAPAEKLVCTGTVTGGTYQSVTVPEGESCTLLNVNVRHNVKSLHGAKDVRVLNSYVGGNVHVRNATGLVQIGEEGCRFDPVVRVNVMVQNSHHVLICFVTGHVLQVTGNDGQITVRDSRFHQIKVSRNLEYTGPGKEHVGHRDPGAIRILRNVARQHIHVFGNHASRKLILKDNSPTPIVR